MRHDTPTAVGKQSPRAATRPRRFVAMAAVAACLAGGVLTFTPVRHAGQSHVAQSTHRIVDGCTGSAGPCAPTRR